MSDENNASLNSFPADPKPSRSRKTVKSYGISIDSSKIHEVAYEEQPTSLRELGVNVFDQDVFEEGVLQQVDEAIAAQEEALERQRLEKDLTAVEEELRIGEQKINRNERNQPASKLLILDHDKLERKRDHLLQRLCTITRDGQEHCTNLLHREETIEDDESRDGEISDKSLAEKLLQIGSHKETEVERLIRLGEMTPFGSMVDNHTQVVVDDLQKQSAGKMNESMLDKEPGKTKTKFEGSTCIKGSGVLSCDGHFGSKVGQASISLLARTSQCRTGSMSDSELGGNGEDIDDDQANDDGDYDFFGGLDNEDNDNILPLESDDDYIPDDEELKLSWKDDQFLPDHGTASLEAEKGPGPTMKAKKPKKRKKKQVKKTKRLHRSTKDDGDDNLYQTRIREMKLKKVLRKKGIDYSGKSDEEEEEFPNEECPDEEFQGGLKVPGTIWHKLFRYQKTGVKWLWELHCQQAGGIVGDEMGLGKTIQIIAFLAGLKYSKIGQRETKRGVLGPVLIVCPATVLYQWVAEFHRWWPEFRVAVLHDTGSYQGAKDSLINKIRNTPGVLITTYSGVRLNQEHLLPFRWDYVILDEGHTIRNPDAEVTLTCKQFRTPHRIILSGSPMQNNLRELWSLFDFVFPGKLGTLPVFMQEFSVPITMGGYANASPVQVQTAYKCACVLRDTINPYLLRRLKKDVKMKLDLPNKNEQVLFCRLTEEQTEIYKEYLASREVGSILSGTMKVFPGLIMLRKICNHPDLTTEAGSLWKLRKDQELAETGQATGEEEDSEYGYWKRSGKLVVVHSLLKLWKKQKHKVLLFTQTRQMLKILEIFVKSQGYSYCRMDGSTTISSRQPLIERFNQDKSIFVFLLTTRVGGLGVNLVGANRVIIYDPDWNPGTDMQARERAWRVGQKKDVTIYRLLTTGTIEEKIYHRQIFKQFLTNRVLKDPKQRRFFKSNDLFELFTLDTSDNSKTGTETGAIFAGLGCEVEVPSSQRRGAKRKSSEPVDSGIVMKMIKDKTKEILKTQFSQSKETFTQISTNAAFENGVKKDNEGRSNYTEVSGALKISNDFKGNTPNASNCTKRPTDDSDTKSNCTDSRLIHSRDEDPIQTASATVCDQRLSVEGSTNTVLGDIMETGSNLQDYDVDSTHTSSKGLSEIEKKDLNSAPSGVSPSSVVDQRKKAKKVDGKLTEPWEENKTKSKKSKKRKKRNKIEGIRIGQLSYYESYVSKRDSEKTEKRRDDDNYILRKLFKNSGVLSALQHDTIVNSGNSDHILVENEAQRVAAQAAEALKRSRELCMQHRSSGLPTWTGQSGFAGSPHGVPKKTIFGPKAREKASCKEDATKHFSGEFLLEGTVNGETNATSANPISSTQLLARMRARNFAGGNNNAGNEVPSTDKKYEQVMIEVSRFIATQCSRPGMATTREILEEFSPKLPVNESAIFRAMLRSICDFERGVSGEGFWVLKSEFSVAS